MLQKIKTTVKDPKYKPFYDVRNIGLAVFAFLVLWVTWSGSQAIKVNFDLQKRIAKLEQENAVQQLSNENLKLRNDYFKTDQFQELAARRQFGKSAPGETVILIPKEVALSHAAPALKQSEQPEPTKPVVNKPWYQRNLEAWLQFFVHGTVSGES